MRISVAATFVAAGLVASAASAQLPTASFRGFRLEGQAGWDRYQNPIGDNDKFAYGGSAGFDGQIGRIVIGPEFDYWHPNRGQNTVSALTTAGNTRYRQARDQYGVDVRIGYLVTPALLLFGKGGYVSDAQRRYLSSASGLAVRGSDHVDGYQAGGGAEYTLHDRFAFAPAGLYVSAQYAYSRFDNGTSDQHAMAGIGIRFR